MISLCVIVQISDMAEFEWKMHAWNKGMASYPDHGGYARGKVCYCCGSPRHLVRDCPQVLLLPEWLRGRRPSRAHRLKSQIRHWKWLDRRFREQKACAVVDGRQELVDPQATVGDVRTNEYVSSPFAVGEHTSVQLHSLKAPEVISVVDTLKYEFHVDIVEEVCRASL